MEEIQARIAARMDTGGRVTISMVDALDRFITPKLTKFAWLSDRRNGWLKQEIITNLLELCCIGNSDGLILEALSERETHRDMAYWISTVYLGRENTAPNSRKLRSLTDGVIKLFHDLCQENFDRIDIGFEAVADHDPSPYTQTSPQTVGPAAGFPLFRLPAELRNMVYREVLILPDGGVACSFAPPALLCANKVLRDDAMPVFYGENRFEIAVKRSPLDAALASDRMGSFVDMWTWRRFLHMWDVFNCFGTNCLRYVRHITLIYQLSMDVGCVFECEFDKHLGLRFSSDPFEEDYVRKDGKDSYGESSTNENDIRDEDIGEDDQVPEDDSDRPVGVFELNRGTINLRNRREAQFHLFHTMCEYGTDRMWNVYPLKRFAQMLWRCARDCSLAMNNVDFICEDLPYWVDNRGSRTRDEPVELTDADDEDD